MKLDTKRIKVLLAELEMNQVELASVLGVAPQAISAILIRKTCTLDTLGKISKALGVSPAEIIKED